MCLKTEGKLVDRLDNTNVINEKLMNIVYSKMQTCLYKIMKRGFDDILSTKSLQFRRKELKNEEKKFKDLM